MLLYSPWFIPSYCTWPATDLALCHLSRSRWKTEALCAKQTFPSLFHLQVWNYQWHKKPLMDRYQVVPCPTYVQPIYSCMHTTFLALHSEAFFLPSFFQPAWEFMGRFHNLNQSDKAPVTSPPSPESLVDSLQATCNVRTDPLELMCASLTGEVSCVNQIFSNL